MTKNKLGPIDTETLVDLLRLVSVKVEPEIVDAWTPEQREQAEKWAAKEALIASDNLVRRLPRPAHVPAPKPEDFYGEGVR